MLHEFISFYLITFNLPKTATHLFLNSQMDARERQVLKLCFTAVWILVQNMYNGLVSEDFMPEEAVNTSPIRFFFGD